jgi:hypothetical protein
MANYYTEFSVELDVLTEENANRVYEIYSNPIDEEAEEIIVGFELKIDPTSPTRVWINSGGEGGDLECVSAFIKQICSQIKLSGKWGFEWANTCSKPRLDAFGGGAVLFDLATGDEAGSIFTHEWLSNNLLQG